MAGCCVTIEEMCENLGGCHPQTVLRMINARELPPFDYGRCSSKYRAWHNTSIEEHARARQKQLAISTPSMVLIKAAKKKKYRKVKKDA